MAESRYTKGLKKCLHQELEKQLINTKLTVIPEFELKDGSMLDLAVISKYDKGYKKDKNPNKLLGIEIEVISGKAQIIKNYESLKQYTFSKERIIEQG